jgi:NAD(P)-dependent dehydrogenase (short-subunit alcohol dehydrogenase family)
MAGKPQGRTYTAEYKRKICAQIGAAGRGVLSVLALAAAALASAGAAPSISPEPGAPAPETLKGRQIILITGSTDGLGREVARRLAATGAHIIVHGRNRERGLEVVDEIKKERKGSAAFYAADLASLEQVRKLAEAILRDYDRLDVLINNAGVFSTAGGRQLSADGYELHFAVNYLSGFLLTRLLLPRMVSSAPSRIVNVASISQTPIDFDDVMLERGYSAGRAYAQSKLAQIMFTFDLARELEGTRVIVNAVHPASLMDTNMVRQTRARPRTTVYEGAASVLQLVTAPGLGSGQYFDQTSPSQANIQAYDRAAREKLKRLSLQLTGDPGR